MPRAKTATNGSPRAKKTAVRPENGHSIVAPEMTQGAIPAEVESEIRRRAYELYEKRGCEPGHEHEDWVVAEREVLARHHQLTTA